MRDTKKCNGFLWMLLLVPASVLADDTSEQTYQYEAVYTADVITNTRGGLDTGTGVLGNLDLKLTLNPWQNGQIFLYAISNLGSKPNRDLVGSVQGVDNIEVETNTAKLYEAWIEQGFASDHYSIRAGLYDLNSEFYVTDAAGLFINSSSGIGAEFAQTGPSIFPTTGVALRFKALLPADIYWQAAVLDGVPGDVNDPRHTHIQFHEDEGKLLVSEFGWSHGLPGLPEGGKYSLGYWEYTENFDDLVNVDAGGNPLRHKNNGAYLLAEQTLLDADKHDGRSLVAFVRYGRANNDVNALENNLNTGVVFSGLAGGEWNDQIGLVYSSVETTDKFRQAQLIAAAPVESREEIIELTYRLDINRWLAVQPDIQYVINPGTDPTLNNAVVVGARFEFNLLP